MTNGVCRYCYGRRWLFVAVLDQPLSSGLVLKGSPAWPAEIRSARVPCASCQPQFAAQFGGERPGPAIEDIIRAARP